MGEEHYEQQQGGGGTKVWVIVLVVIAAVCVLGMVVMGVLGALMMPAMMKAKEKANASKCASNLRMVGLGAASYAGDKRFFPHVTGLRELDGDARTNHGPKVFRALINYGYLDSAEGYVCPSSFDLYVPTTSYDPREWFWLGQTRSATSENPLGDGMNDPTLLETDELSYGWTRRGFNNNLSSNTPMAADRSVRRDPDAAYLEPGENGNHTDGVNVVYADCATRFVNTDMDPNAFSDLLDPEGPALGLVSPRQ